MYTKSKKNCEYLIVGAGIAGLYIADALASYGANIVVIEEDCSLAPGPTTRNGGYIHFGGFHSALLAGEEEAKNVAKRCMVGAERLLQRFPESIISDGTPTYLTIRDTDRAKIAKDRWDRFGVMNEKVGKKEFEKVFPDMNYDDFELISKVKDLPVNYRLICKKLYVDLKRRNVEFLFNANTISRKRDSVIIDVKGHEYTIVAKKTIYCTGYKTTNTVSMFRHLWSVVPSISLWKSHVISIPRYRKNGIMQVDPGSVSMMPMGDYSVICRSQDDISVKDINFNIENKSVSEMTSILIKEMPESEQYMKNAHLSACLKPSIVDIGIAHRSVDSTVMELSEYEMLALPGKATETPLLVDSVIRALSNELCNGVTLRPGDKFTSMRCQ